MAAVLLLFLFAPALRGQMPDVTDHNLHGWYTYSGNHSIGSKWSIIADAQWRRANVITDWQEYVLRPGINYSVNDALSFAAGWGTMKLYPFGEFPPAAGTPEQRIFQQMIVKHSTGPITWSHRGRVEQRFLHALDNGRRDWRYQNRFRYSGKGTVPLRMAGNTNGRYYLAFYDEIMLNFGANMGPSGHFDQNRVFVGIGFATGPDTRVETGYLQQTRLQRNGRVLEYNHTFLINVISNAPFRRK